MTFKKRIIGLFALLLIAGGVFGFYTLSSAPSHSPSSSPSPAAQAMIVLQQGSILENAFKRMLSLGYKPEDIRYNSGQQPDIVGDRGILDVPLVPPAAALITPHAAWALGNGQIIGAFNEDATDIAFYLSGLTQATCQALNTALWHDAETISPVASGVSLRQWQQQQVNIFALFQGKDFQGTGLQGKGLQGKDRDSGCIESSEKDYIYYRVVVAQ